MNFICIFWWYSAASPNSHIHLLHTHFPTHTTLSFPLLSHFSIKSSLDCLYYPWSVANLPGVIKENWLSLSHQLSSDPQWEVRFVCLPPHWGFCLSWACTGPRHTVTTTVSTYVPLLCFVKRTLFLWHYPHYPPSLAIIIIFVPLPQTSLSLGEGGVTCKSCLGPSTPQSLNSLHIGGLCVNYHLFKKFLWWRLRDTLICGIATNY